jgi:regulator of RNase E activity RraA
MPELRTPAVTLPIRGTAFTRLTTDQRHSLEGISTATASATLHKMGIKNVFLRGPSPLQDGQSVVGSALTLQFMPQRGDIGSGDSQEYIESKTALWAVFDAVEEGDILVIQAFGDRETGCVGEMLASHLHNRGGVGAVIDGCVRDWPKVREIGVPFWAVGKTPNYSSQTSLFPWAYDVPVACGGALVMPGDAIIADDDGAVVVPRAVIEDFVTRCRSVTEWEHFSRSRIDAGGALSKYYPLSDDAEREYAQWRETNHHKTPVAGQ